VREGETEHVAPYERADLDVPDRVRRERREVRSVVERPEEIPAPAEGVGGERDEELPLDDEEREVVRDRVDERDRHEARDEGLREVALRTGKAAG